MNPQRKLQWEACVKLIKGLKCTVPYGTIAEPLDLFAGAAELARLLGQQMEDDWKNKRPLFSALIVSIKTGMPGEGFFECAKALGIPFENTTKGKEKFWKSEIEKFGISCPIVDKEAYIEYKGFMIHVMDLDAIIYDVADAVIYNGEQWSEMERLETLYPDEVDPWSPELYETLQKIEREEGRTTLCTDFKPIHEIMRPIPSIKVPSAEERAKNWIDWYQNQSSIS